MEESLAKLTPEVLKATMSSLIQQFPACKDRINQVFIDMKVRGSRSSAICAIWDRGTMSCIMG